LEKEKKDKLVSIEQILKKMGKSSSYNIDLSKYNDDPLNLSCLLNILDGLIELHGVMVIFTTNHPEKLDDAFLRPGRIDFKQEFKRANTDTIKSIINTKFKLNNITGFEFPTSQFVDYVISPAEIQSICFQTDDINECITELLKEQEKNMSRLDKLKK
jgi:mitochondrial chaperone BCS1